MTFPPIPNGLKDWIELARWLGKAETWAKAVDAGLEALAQAEVHVAVGATAIDPAWDVVECVGAGGYTLTLPTAKRAGVRRTRPLRIINHATAAVTLATPAGETVANGAASISLNTASLTDLLPNGDAAWEPIGGAMRATSLVLSSILDVAGQVTLRGLTVWPGATTGSSNAVQLIGDLRHIIFGTVNAVKIGVASYTAGLNIGFTNGATEKIGFYGATPIAQQVLPTGAGKTVDDVITFLQLWGAVRQS